MKMKGIALLLVLAFCFSLSACGGEKRPIDYPDTTWTCEEQNIKFSVSDDGKITDATMVDKNGKTISISLVFSDVSEGKVSITSPDGGETYVSGTCTYGKDSFSITVTDVYNTDLSQLPLILKFKR